ncbi:type II toxin-antitoxin system PemK/MazF family toxin [Candidatus Pacearchaeota archaeon]|nr:type II toxin-antitoxin system PemK/MazF family toxin [Candidatus Pacearchaeota archaeon]
MMFKQGDIIVVPFPFSDLSGFKQRPVLILSNDYDNLNSEDTITCGITSNLKDIKHSVLIDSENLEEGSIPLKSRIKVDKIFTLERKIIRKKVAKVDRGTLIKVKNEFLKLI